MGSVGIVGSEVGSTHHRSRPVVSLSPLSLPLISTSLYPHPASVSVGFRFPGRWVYDVNVRLDIDACMSRRLGPEPATVRPRVASRELATDGATSGGVCSSEDATMRAYRPSQHAGARCDRNRSNDLHSPMQDVLHSTFRAACGSPARPRTSDTPAPEQTPGPTSSGPFPWIPVQTFSYEYPKGWCCARCSLRTRRTPRHEHLRGEPPHGGR